MPKTLRGTLDTFSLADLLQWLEINSLSGRVTITRGDVRRTVDLKKGAIVYVSSTLPEERLGVFLAARGVLPEPVVYELLAENFVTGKNLTRLILDRKLVPRPKLAETVESLAREVLLDLFHWDGATFEFDPLSRTEDLLHIHLSLRGQVLAFHGVKSVDDSARIRLRAPSLEDVEAAWERDFHTDSLAGAFWSILESTCRDGVGPATIRDQFYVFNLFADQVHRKLLEPVRPLPIFDDTAAMLLGVLDSDGDPDKIVQISALDPFLTLDLIFLANSLRSDVDGLTGTAHGAADAVGPDALRTYVGLLAGPASPKTSATDKVERVVRRTALSTAVAASHLASSHQMDLGHAYTLGLLEPLGGYDLLKLLMTMDFERGPFRAATLQHFRTLLGRVLAKKLNFPKSLEEVLGSSGQVTSRSASSEQLIFFAKQMISGDQIGREWTSEDPELADRYAALALKPELPREIAQDIQKLFEILRL